MKRQQLKSFIESMVRKTVLREVHDEPAHLLRDLGLGVDHVVDDLGQHGAERLHVARHVLLMRERVLEDREDRAKQMVGVVGVIGHGRSLSWNRRG